MAAIDNIQHEQLKMFMTPQELKDRLTFSFDLNDKFSYDNDTSRRETMPQMWQRKLDESQEDPEDGTHGAGLWESIYTQGYSGTPVHMAHESGTSSARIMDAHHRVAAAADVAETTGKEIYMPVIHHEDIDRNSGRYRLHSLTVPRGDYTSRTRTPDFWRFRW